jgi:hypothetical protein
MKRKDLETFLLSNGIEHSFRVEFAMTEYFVWSYRRNEHGGYITTPSKSGPQPIVDVKRFEYDDEDKVMMVW